ncbi:hypothetical protein OSTOST_17217, partial [Ostertagia ostertagi]
YKQLITDVLHKQDHKEVKLPRNAQRFRVADFCIDNGDLKMLCGNAAVRVVPKSKRRAVFEEAHGWCNGGAPQWDGSCIVSLKDRYFGKVWRPISQKCLNMCERVPTRNERVRRDCGCMTCVVEYGLTERGNKYALVVIDHFSKFVGAYPIPNKSAETVTRAFFERWICDGCRWPKQIHSDQGPEFINSVFWYEQIGYWNANKNAAEENYNSSLIGTLLLPMVVFAYNSSPHDAIGESPFYLLHAFDPNCPSNHELLAGIQLAQECTKALNDKYKTHMKNEYDKRNKIDVDKLPKVGDRVFLKLPREKAGKKYPKLSEPWGGPYRVIETSENSALISNINEKEEPIRIPFDALIVVPIEVENSVRTTRTKRKRRRQANSNHVVCRATADGVDTSPLGLFFRCPGRHGQEGDGCRYSCSIQEKTFKDVVPNASEAIANLRFDTIFSLARLLSIYDHERNEERKRFLMLDQKHFSISITGVQKAYLFYKKFCDHVFRSLILYDGSSLCLAHDGGTGWPMDQLNQATNEAVRYAQANNWDEVNRNEPNKTLLILPDSRDENVERRLYTRLSEISGFLERAVARTCVLVGPTTDEPLPKRDWCKLASSLAAAARTGIKVLAVAPPRGDNSYMRNRLI